MDLSDGLTGAGVAVGSSTMSSEDRNFECFHVTSLSSLWKCIPLDCEEHGSKCRDPMCVINMPLREDLRSGILDKENDTYMIQGNRNAASHRSDARLS